ncbi:hypothetical protein PO124_26475 [Bacillus licheniformis]|nr:hypothetical protein [Bacillus licheniformis]
MEVPLIERKPLFPETFVSLVKDMLTKTDGSTTKAIETLIGGKAEIEVFSK